MIKKLSGGSWIAISCLIVVNCFDKSIYIPSLLLIAISDTMSSLIGKNFGKTFILYTKKTLEGFFGFILGGIVIYIILIILKIDFIWWIFLISLLVSALCELFLKIDDNISISISYSIVYFIIFALL